MSESGEPLTVHLEFSEEDAGKLRQAAGRRGVSPTALVHECVKTRLDLEESIQTWAPEEPGQRPSILEFVRGRRPGPPVAYLIGFVPRSIEVGRVVLEFQPRKAHANLAGTLHGGILCDLGDAAMGIAYASTMEPGDSFTTVELKANFLKPVWTESIQARADVVKKGRTLGLVQCRITDEDDNLVAVLSSTCMTLGGDQARNR